MLSNSFCVSIRYSICYVKRLLKFLNFISKNRTAPFTPAACGQGNGQSSKAILKF